MPEMEQCERCGLVSDLAGVFARRDDGTVEGVLLCIDKKQCDARLLASAMNALTEFQQALQDRNVPAEEAESWLRLAMNNLRLLETEDVERLLVRPAQRCLLCFGPMPTAAPRTEAICRFCK